jgi:manganese/zinc/iron transport system substrate-binding protein
MTTRVCAALALLVTVGGFCGQIEPVEAAGPQSYPYRITCTVGMVADLVREVAGEKAEVEQLLGPGVDPHLYQATRTDVAKLLQADVIFYSGLMLEGRMADTLVRVGRKRPVYAVTELIDRQSLLDKAGEAGHADPHVWMDVSLWKQCVGQVARTLAEFDPPHADYYKQNADRYATTLDALHAYATKALASVPPKSRVLVTAHDAFGYMARAYGLEVRGIQGVSTESEAGIVDVNQLIELLVTRRVKAVFVETSVSQKNAKALLEGAAARGHTVAIGGSLYSDAMGKAGTYEGTYVGMIDHNVTTIARALGGTAPAKGMQGKLAARK